MKAKVSKAQLEVWEWKEKAYNQIKDMSLDKGIDFIMEQTRHISDKIKKRSKQKARARKN
jgi:hypothetical protein